MVLIHLPSGLRYHVLQPPRWSAPGPSRGRTVLVSCEGWIDDDGVCGEKIASHDNLSFPLSAGHVINGIDDGVLTMRVGEKRRFYIPAQLAYGDNGDGSSVPPNCDLIYDITLNDIR